MGKFRDKFKKKKTFEPEKSHKRTEISYQGGSHRVALAHDVDYHPRQTQFELPTPPVMSRSPNPLIADRSVAKVQNRSSITELEAVKDATANNQNQGWNPYVAAAAVGVGALVAPIAAIGVVAAAGCAVTAAGATIVANHISDNNRLVRESEHRSDVARAAIKAESRVRRHEISVGAQQEVIMKMVERGHYGGGSWYNNRDNSGSLSGSNRLMIEDESHSDSD